MFHRDHAAVPSLVFTIVLGACGAIPLVADAGDCTPHELDLPGGSSVAPSAIRLASSCHRIVQVDGRDDWYILVDELTLTEEAVAELQPLGRITHANDSWAPRLASADDLQTWAIAGYDPALAFWSTAEDLRGTNTYVLWTIDDCSAADACLPPVCEFLVSDAPSTRERCGGQSA